MTSSPMFDFGEPETWPVPKAAGTCRRDPKAGPGSCHYWWEGCPDAEKRGCNLLWHARKFVRENNDQGGNAAAFLAARGLKP